MATTATPNATDQTSSNTTQTVDASLWWEPFNSLLTELENAYLFSDLPPSLEKKLKDNFSWFLETLSRFKPPNQKSRQALDSQQIKIDVHELKIQPELKDAALRISSVVCLDEVQSYILVKRSVERNNTTIKDLHPEILSLVMIDYYIERQCLLKCTRQILMHALYFGSQSEGSAISEEAQRLISKGLDSKLLSTFEDLLSSNYPDQMDVDLYTLWAEETLIEDNLILDILFLAYYESYCACDATCWEKLFALYEGIVNGSCNFHKLAISPEAVNAIYHAKVQLQLILIEALNLENLLQMIHDDIPFRQGTVVFSETDIQEMDATISSCSIFEAKEAGPLILAWAVFLCLVSSLPEKEKNNLLMEIDHIGYVRQAFEASSLGYFLEILQSNTLKDTDGPLLGYRSVLRTFISAFIASYEISLQSEDDNLKLILDILCKIYRGEESLCIQFWDKNSFIDGPVRCLLCNLEGEFPYRIVELVSLLSALSEGAWPSECVFNFLDKSVGLSTPLEINNDSLVDSASRMVETRFPLDVSGVEGLVIPSKSKGQILRMIDRNIALVRWENYESGVLVLLLRLAKELHYRTSEEIIIILDLLSRLVTSNTAVCYSLLNAWNWNSSNDGVTAIEDEKKYFRIDVVEIVCALVKSVSPSVDGAVIMSMGVNILAKMLKCLPSHVASKAVKGNIFDVALNLNPFVDGSNSLSSGTWLLSGRLAKMLLMDCEQSDCSLTLSVLDFTMKLLETGMETDTVLALIVFSVQYVLVNHEFWKYKVKHARWKVTVKVLEIMKKCTSMSCYQKLGKVVYDILLCDASVHSALFRIICTTTENLEKLQMSRVFEILDIEGLQLAISHGLDVLTVMVFASKDSTNLPVFHQAILSPSTKPVPVITAAISLMSYYHYPKIQIGAARLLSELLIADLSQSCTYSGASLSLDDKQVANFRRSIYRILLEQSPWNEGLIVATLKLLTCAAHNQPAFLTDVIASKEYLDPQSSTSNSEAVPNETHYGSFYSNEKSIMDIILQYVKESEDLLKSKPAVLLNLGNFLRALWQGAPQFRKIVDKFKSSDKFWKHLTSSVMFATSNQDKVGENTGNKLKSKACRYQYQSIVLDILGYEIFFQKKMMHAKLSSQVSKLPANGTQNKEDESLVSLKEILSTWCKSSSLGNLIKDYVTCEYETINHFHAKVAACLFAVRVMVKLRSGDFGSLSVSLIEKIVTLSDKMRNLPAFSELLAQYAERGYSVGKELENLITSDLFYHIEGELKGRKIDNGPFKDLFQYLLDSEFLEAYKYKQDDDLLSNTNGFYLYDISRLKADLGLELWDLSALKPFKGIAETMLLRLEDLNSIILHSNSKFSALKGLNSLLHMHDGNLTENEASTGLKISEQVVSSCIDHICQCAHTTIESLTPLPDASENILDILTVQAELLLLLTRSITVTPQPSCVLVLKTSGYGLKVLSSSRPSVNAGKVKKLLLMLILNSVKSTFKDLHSGDITEIEVSAESSNASLGILPILCNFVEKSDHCTLSLTAIDLIVKGLSTSSTWLPIIQKHLPLQRVLQKLQDVNLGKTVSVVLKFLLNLAPLRQGAEMLLKGGIIASIRTLLSDFSDCWPFSVIQSERSLSNGLEKTERPQSVWGLCLALLTAIIHSLGDGSSSTTTVEYVMVCILVEKAPLISFYLSAPDFPSEGREKKRARGLKSNVSLTDLKETHNTLTLICALARHRSSWNKVLKDMDSQLREKSIHLLAFISKATQRPEELSVRDTPLLCNPVIKEEFEWFEKPSFINSKNGWFALSALGCKSNPKFSSLSSGSTALVIRNQSNDGSNLPRTQFLDMVAIEIYEIAFLVLKFLCMQAEGAVKKAEEVGFVDVDHFPELPMPEILHGLQDQGMVIISELCEANKTKQLAPELQDVCLLLLQIIVMALYLEFCVIQVCGIKPVLGYVDTFTKELRLLIRATDGYSFFKEPLKDLKQIVSFVYPELVRAEAFF